MSGLRRLIALVVVLVPLALSGQKAIAEVQHVVGDDRGWDPSSDLTSWSSGRLFRVGDIIWFTYSAVQESVVELESIRELLLCDLTNPIKMYTNGLDKVPLDGEGSRYFASGNVGSCKKGLKLHVNVHPKEQNENQTNRPSTKGQDIHNEERDGTFPVTPCPQSKADGLPPADGPTLPSGSVHFGGLSFMLLGGFLLSYLGFY